VAGQKCFSHAALAKTLTRINREVCVRQLSCVRDPIVGSLFRSALHQIAVAGLRSGTGLTTKICLKRRALSDAAVASKALPARGSRKRSLLHRDKSGLEVRQSAGRQGAGIF
jgi:hypothetical protein